MKTFLSRRDFLKQGALAAALPWSAFQTPSAGWKDLDRTDTAKRVIVIGAGLAGLAAAYQLVEAGRGSLVGRASRPAAWGRNLARPGPMILSTPYSAIIRSDVHQPAR